MLTHARRFADTGIARVDAILKAIEQDRPSSVQPGLFDRRAHFAHLAQRAAHEEAMASQTERRTALSMSAELTTRAPRLRLVLVPPS